MTPTEIEQARKLRASGASDAAIAAGMIPPVTRQHVHAMLGPRKRAAKPRRSTEPIEPIDPAAFAAALRDWRARHGLSQAEAAKLLKVNAHSISFWETGANGCSLAGPMLLLLNLLDSTLTT